MLPLDNIRILDVSSRAPGPFCTMTLSDLGAEVLLVEAPRNVDVGRSPMEAEDPAWEAACNPLRRNKRSIVLNLKDREAKDIFLSLARDMDVVVEGFRPGVAERLGIGYGALKALNPRLVYCAISGYGQDGPYRLLPGHDVNYISFAGALGLIGARDGPPAIPYNLLGDYAAGGLLSAVAIMSALWVRERTGEGQYIDMSMTDGALYLIAPVMGAYFANGQAPRRGRTRLNGGTPDYQVYRCKDAGYLSIGCIEAKFWENLCRAVGRPDLIGAQHDGSRHESAIREMQGVFATRTRDEWFEALRDKEVACAKVYGAEEVGADGQVQARRMIAEMEGPGGRRVRQVGVAARLEGTPGRVRSVGVAPGTHTREVLRALGHSEAAIEALYRRGAVG